MNESELKKRCAELDAINLPIFEQNVRIFNGSIEAIDAYLNGPRRIVMFAPPLPNGGNASLSERVETACTEAFFDQLECERRRLVGLRDEAAAHAKRIRDRQAELTSAPSPREEGER